VNTDNIYGSVLAIPTQEEWLYSKPTDLASYCRNAAYCVRRTDKKAELFIHLRYDLMNVYFPHKVFSTNQVGLDFFQVTLDIIEGRLSIPSKKDEKGNKKSEYELNYIEWLELHKI
jgi:hypothetical protein